MLQRLVTRANIKPNTLALLCDHAAPSDHWLKGVVTSMIYDRDEVCPQIVLCTPNGKKCVRDIKKVCFLDCDV